MEEEEDGGGCRIVCFFFRRLEHVVGSDGDVVDRKGSAGLNPRQPSPPLLVSLSHSHSV